MTDRQAAIELLTAVHDFPAPVVIKVIGVNQDDFERRVVKVVPSEGTSRAMISRVAIFGHL